MTAQPAVDVPATLQCGCRRGFELCREARRLWLAVAIAHDRRDFEEYDRRLNAYNDHMGVEA